MNKSFGLDVRLFVCILFWMLVIGTAIPSVSNNAPIRSWLMMNTSRPFCETFAASVIAGRIASAFKSFFSSTVYSNDSQRSLMASVSAIMCYYQSIKTVRVVFKWYNVNFAVYPQLCPALLWRSFNVPLNLLGEATLITTHCFSGGVRALGTLTTFCMK